MTNQVCMIPSKEINKTPITHPNKMEISELSDKGFIKNRLKGNSGNYNNTQTTK